MSITEASVSYYSKEKRIISGLIKAMQDTGTRDELGLSTVRDFFSNIFFPGITVIQTKARYFLLVPWVYGELEQEGVPSAKIERKDREREVWLMDELKAGGETTGIIGASAGKNIISLPSDIYWPGLCTWDIFRPGKGNYVTRDVYHSSLDDIYRSRKSESKDEADEVIYSDNLETWHHSLPEPPDDYMDETTFKLTRAEAEFLKERVQENFGGKLLEFLVSNQVRGLRAIPYLWETGLEMPDDIAKQVDSAERFSLLMHGASILYNIYVSSLMGEGYDYEWIKGSMEEWFQDYRTILAARGDWSPDSLVGVGAKVELRTSRFCREWHGIASSFTDWTELLEPNHKAFGLIRSREVLLKGNRARMVSQEARDRWNGSSGMSRLDYRWHVAKDMIADIVEGLGRNA
ncbi:MAG: hypothetical protein KJ792_16375 [Actinobacteria bacterium]|nr:hypothetical protein [Actinomycetota bacterium]